MTIGEWTGLGSLVTLVVSLLCGVVWKQMQSKLEKSERRCEESQQKLDISMTIMRADLARHREETAKDYLRRAELREVLNDIIKPITDDLTIIKRRLFGQRQQHQDDGA